MVEASFFYRIVYRVVYSILMLCLIGFRGYEENLAVYMCYFK